MDPTQAIDAANKLATGSAQTILAFLCVALAVGFGWAIWRLISEIKCCGTERTEILTKNIEAQHRISDALDGNSQVMKAALDALKRS